MWPGAQSCPLFTERCRKAFAAGNIHLGFFGFSSALAATAGVRSHSTTHRCEHPQASNTSSFPRLQLPAASGPWVRQDALERACLVQLAAARVKGLSLAAEAPGRCAQLMRCSASATSACMSSSKCRPLTCASCNTPGELRPSLALRTPPAAGSGPYSQN